MCLIDFPCYIVSGRGIANVNWEESLAQEKCEGEKKNSSAKPVTCVDVQLVAPPYTGVHVGIAALKL